MFAIIAKDVQRQKRPVVDVSFEDLALGIERQNRGDRRVGIQSLASAMMHRLVRRSRVVGHLGNVQDASPASNQDAVASQFGFQDMSLRVSPESHPSKPVGAAAGFRRIDAALQHGDISALALADERLASISRLQPVLNAFIAVDADEARSRAAASDHRRQSGRSLGVLDGAPIGLKDMFSSPGRRCSFGAPLGEAEQPAHAATIVQRLHAAGAVNLGFLNMAPFALGPTGHNSTFGDCRNPWGADRIAGGSSSGAGAAVSAGLVAGAIGSDTGGSVRIPAACCGVVGLRPTSGRISRYGAMPLAPSFDVIGPIAPTAEDVALLFSALCGPDPLCPDTLSSPAWSDRPLDPDAARGGMILYPDADIAAHADADVARAIREAVETLQASGLTVHRRALPDINALHGLANLVQSAEAAAIHADRLVAHPEAYTQHIRDRLEPGFGVAATDYIDAVGQRARLRQAFVRDVLRGDGILLVPTLGRGTPTLAETDPSAMSSSAHIVANLTRWTRWVSYLDLPAISTPCGFDRNGMPVGLQMIAAPFEERRLLEMAAFYERLTNWPTRPRIAA